MPGYDPRDPRDDRRDPRDDRRDPRDDRRDQRTDDRRAARPDGNEERALLPEGEYRVKCVAHKFGYAKTGTEQIGARLAILEGPHKGSTLIWYGYFTPDSEETTIKSMRALGFSGVDFSDLSSMYEGEGIAVVQHEPDQEGRMRARVRWINGADVAMAKEMNDADIRRFGDRYRGLLTRLGGKASTSGGPGRPPPSRPANTKPDGSYDPPPDGSSRYARGGSHDVRDDRGPPPPPDDRDAPPWNGRRA